MTFPVREQFRLVGRRLRRDRFEKTINPFLDHRPRGWLAHVLQAWEETKGHMLAFERLIGSERIMQNVPSFFDATMLQCQEAVFDGEEFVELALSGTSADLSRGSLLDVHSR